MKEGWTYKKLGEVCNLYQPKTIPQKQFVSNGEYPVYGSNGIIGYYNEYNHTDKEILIACRGTCGIVNVSQPYSWINGNAMVVHPLTDRLEFDFLKYQLVGKDMKDVITGAAIPQITRQSLSKLLICIPPFAEQERIVAELDLLSGIIEKKKEQLKAYDQLAQSIFYTMFGDPITNEKGWEVKCFGEIASFKNGLNFHPKDDGFSIKCIGVGDFQERKVLNDFKTIKDVTIDDVVDNSYYLKDGDIIIVRSNGSKELVGRNMIVYPKNLKVTYSGFCIRCRLNTPLILPIILNRILSHRSTMIVLRQEGRGCNISNINQKILSSLSIPLPPLHLQEEFAEKVEAIERQKALIQQSIDEVQTLFDSRMDYWFG
ncbi:MAG: restriction endonuclease subunit S [Muribaculaceae bacterium]|nr:restriction endonuclease subunit S [Muribaculaceae bacterium]